MQKYRFYLENYKKDQNKVFIFDKRVVNQIRKVLRMKKGDKIFVFWGNGNDYELSIQEINKNKIVGSLAGGARIDGLFLPKKIILCPSLIEQNRFELILEKATEIGVSKFIPIIARYSVKKMISKNQRERWRKIIIEAVEQSGGSFLPGIEKEIKFREFLNKTKNISAEKIILSEFAGKEQSIFKVINRSAKEIYLLFGPEGGWSREKLELAAKYGWKPVSLGKKILRAETAAIISSFIAIQQ